MREFLAGERAAWVDRNSKVTAPLDAVYELVAAGGKRIRPAFCVSGYLAAGGDADDTRIVDAAIALELLHACALIHDDVVDESAQRRGAPTAHVRYEAEHAARQWHGPSWRFGEAVAILAGDLALVYSDRFMSGISAELDRLWAELRAELIFGQYMDVRAAAELATDPELSRWIAVLKSGHYTIHRPLAVGAVVAGRPDLAGAFEEYGVSVGQAFQLRDDLIDVFGDAETTGKPAGLDLERHKMTLLMALATQRDPRVHELVTAPQPDLAEIRTVFQEQGIRDEIEAAIGRLVEQGCDALDRAPLAPRWRDELAAMARQVAYRDR
ncbi:geranylgeranyl diphosphate synthase type I [Nocardia mexicana]|uniref:Geranylgeranyl diphosphate synthase type I n=2 Tax=Nocardia mexicana TaxID=279262 RepID=A0A370H770_9NOCA|nr:geranylgeranyl diphosphate synthase type I [Nocardia mexicana]